MSAAVPHDDMSFDTPQILVLIVEEDQVGSESWIKPLRSHTGISLVGVCSSSTRTPSVICHRPDVVITDISQGARPNADGVKRLRAIYPQSRLVVHTVRDDLRSIALALSGEVDGYLLKSDPVPSLEHAIRFASAGGFPVSPTVARRIADHFIAAEEGQKLAGLDQLTRREVLVLERIHAGFTNFEIGRALSVGEEAIRKAVRSILFKLHCANRTEAAAKYARHLGWSESEVPGSK